MSAPLRALLLAALLFAALPAAAQAPVCDLDADGDGGAYQTADDRYETAAELPARFAVGLAMMGETIAIADRHEDAIILLDGRGERTGTLPYPAYEPAALSYDGTLLVAADGADGRIYFLDPASGECVRTIESPMAQVGAAACDAEGRLWIAARGSETMQLIDPFDGTTLRDIKAPTARISALAFDPRGYLWAADASRDQIFLVDVRSGYTIFRLPSPGPVTSGLWIGDGVLHVVDYQTDTLYRRDVTGLHGVCERDDERRGRVTLLYDLQNLGPGLVTGGTVALAIPENGPNQEIETLAWTDGARDESDQWGQRVAVYEVGELAPGATREIRLDAVGAYWRTSVKIYPDRVGELKDVPKEIRERYLVDADKYRVEGDYIRGKVAEIVGDETNPYFMARKLYDFLIGRINYQMIGGWDIAPTVIERGTGSCSEYTFSYVALCRAAGVPARYVGALVLRGEDSSVDTAFHRWAEIYLPNVGWFPVDVNAGDAEWQGDRCFSFGGIANRFLITTRGGGDSTWMKWGYDLEASYRTLGKANVRVEQFAEWDVAEEAE